jgi:hypothetical protein
LAVVTSPELNDFSNAARSFASVSVADVLLESDALETCVAETELVELVEVVEVELLVRLVSSLNREVESVEIADKLTGLPFE